MSLFVIYEIWLEYWNKIKKLPKRKTEGGLSYPELFKKISDKHIAKLRKKTIEDSRKACIEVDECRKRLDRQLEKE